MTDNKAVDSRARARWSAHYSEITALALMAAFLAAVFVAAIVFSRDFELAARGMPLGAAALGLVLVGIEFLRIVARWRKGESSTTAIQPEVPKSTGVETQTGHAGINKKLDEVPADGKTCPSEGSSQYEQKSETSTKGATDAEKSSHRADEKGLPTSLAWLAFFVFLYLSLGVIFATLIFGTGLLRSNGVRWRTVLVVCVPTALGLWSIIRIAQFAAHEGHLIAWLLEAG